MADRGRPRALNAQAQAHVLELAAVGQSTRQIAATLSAAGVKVSSTVVTRFLQQVRRERSEDAKRQVQEHTQTQPLTTDLDILAKTRDQLNQWRESEELPVFTRLFVIDRLGTVIDRRLRLGGATEDDEASQTLAAVIKRLAERG